MGNRRLLRIVVTGEPKELLPRLPSKAAVGPESDICDLEWITVPVLEFKAIPVPKMVLGRAIEEPFDWILFCSPRAVHFWSRELLRNGIDFPATTKVACIGETTAAAADNVGLTPDFFPTLRGTEGFLDEFEPLLRESKSKPNILMPVAENGRKTVQEKLAHLGCEVIAVSVYRTLPRKEIDAEFPVNSVNLILFTSPSSVDAFARHYSIPKTAPVGCLGLYTQEHLRKRGISDPRILPRGDYARVGEILC